MVFMVTSHFNYIDKNGPDILQKIPFYIPQKKEIHIGLKQPQAKWQIFLFLDELFLYIAKPKNHGQGTVCSSVQGEGVTNEATTSMQYEGPIWHKGRSFKEQVQVFIFQR